MHGIGTSCLVFGLLIATETSCIPVPIYSTNGPQRGSAPFQVSAEQERELDRLLADRAAKTSHIKSAHARLITYDYETLFSDYERRRDRTMGALDYLAPDRLRVTQGNFTCIWKPSGQIWIDEPARVVEEYLYPAGDGGYRHFGHFSVLWETDPERLKQRYHIRQVPPSEDSSTIFLEFWPRLEHEQKLVKRIDLALDSDMLPLGVRIICVGGQSWQSFVVMDLTINDGQISGDLFELPPPREGWRIGRENAPIGRAN